MSALLINGETTAKENFIQLLIDKGIIAERSHFVSISGIESVSGDRNTKGLLTYLKNGEKTTMSVYWDRIAPPKEVVYVLDYANDTIRDSLEGLNHVVEEYATIEMADNNRKVILTPKPDSLVYNTEVKLAVELINENNLDQLKFSKTEPPEDYLSAYLSGSGETKNTTEDDDTNINSEVDYLDVYSATVEGKG